jgi:hypothetical protein
MRPTMEQPGAPRQGPRKSHFKRQLGAPCGPRLIILNHLAVSDGRRALLFMWCIMRSLPALSARAFLVTATLMSVPLINVTVASAESRVFIVANQADSYGIDQCLARGEKCGAHAARAYCQSRDFALASSFRRVDPDEITGSVPKDGPNCTHGGCDEFVAITCQR